jgi:hypothetical protein
MKSFKDTVKKVVLEAKSSDSYVPDEAVNFKMTKSKQRPVRQPPPESDDKEENKKDYYRGAYVPDEPVQFHFGKRTKINDKLSIKEHSEDDHNSLQKWTEHNDNKHLGYSSSDITNKISKPFENHESRKSVNRYTSDSRELNNELIDHHKYGDKIDPYQHKKIKHLDVETNHPIGHHITLYSGLGFNPEEHLHGENHLHLPAYTSMTHDKHVAVNFASGKNADHTHKHILALHMRPEDKARHVSHISEYSTEYESILPRRTTLKIHHEPEIKHDYDGHPYKIWHAHIHHQY